MKTPFLLPLLLLVGCAGPVGDRSFVVEKTPAAAALSGQPAAEGAACIRRIVASWRKSPPAVIDGSKVLRVTDYERDKVLDAEGERVPPEEFILAELADGRRIAVRASGTEPKAKFYSFAKADVADADDLAAARARARASALALRAWLEADAKVRAK